MCHQNYVKLDNEPTVVPARNFQRQVSLMVTEEVNLFAKRRRIKERNKLLKAAKRTGNPEV